MPLQKGKGENYTFAVSASDDCCHFPFLAGREKEPQMYVNERHLEIISDGGFVETQPHYWEKGRSFTQQPFFW